MLLVMRGMRDKFLCQGGENMERVVKKRAVLKTVSINNGCFEILPSMFFKQTFPDRCYQTFDVKPCNEIILPNFSERNSLFP